MGVGSEIGDVWTGEFDLVVAGLDVAGNHVILKFSVYISDFFAGVGIGLQGRSGGDFDLRSEEAFETIAEFGLGANADGADFEGVEDGFAGADDALAGGEPPEEKAEGNPGGDEEAGEFEEERFHSGMSLVGCFFWTEFLTTTGAERR